DAGVIADSSHIWWAIRPSGKHPTVELRVCDSCPRLDDAVAIATLFRAMVRTYDRAPGTAEPPDRIGRAIILENKWRAQRYGVWATFVDPYTRRPVTASEQLEGLIAAVDDGEAEDTAAFDRLRSIVCDGSGADRLIEVYQSAIEKDASTQNALRAVVDWAAETTAG
ncbi:MAG: carboxylate--amine ligase, partial [Rhizobiales bacterium]|nr:carboxylate--amine ligase [Hyphomicrobiales bacterium]